LKLEAFSPPASAVAIAQPKRGATQCNMMLSDVTEIKKKALVASSEIHMTRWAYEAAKRSIVGCWPTERHARFDFPPRKSREGPKTYNQDSNPRLCP
jgi:hypothetical protein